VTHATALATVPAGEIVSSAQFGSGSAVQTLAGSVSAFFALAEFDRRRGVATYALRVVNRTSCAVICRTWVVTRSGDALLAYPALFEVAPLSSGATRVPLWLRDFGSFDRAITEVVGDGVRCIVEAPAPARRNRKGVYGAAASIAAAALIFSAGAVALIHATMPRISAFAVPPEAIAGTTVRAEYDAAGAGKLSYSVIAPDGRRVQGGSLGNFSGSIPVAIASSNDPGAYTLRMTITGPLGAATETRVLNTIAAKIPAAAQIDSIAVTPAVAKPGETVAVDYAAAGDSGYVRLQGTDGTIWQQRPFSHAGHTAFVIPPLKSLGEMRVVLHVTKGRTAAESMAGLAVLADQDSAIGASSPIAGDDNPASSGAANADENGTFEVLTPNVQSGGSIRVRIISPRSGMRVALTDLQSHEISGVDIGPETSAVSLRAPVVTEATRYTVVASFTDGFGQESVVAPVTISP